MKTNHSQKGFHVVELVLVLVVVAAIGLVGYGVYNNGKKDKADVATSNNIPTAPEVKTAKDLDTASSTVDQLDTSTDQSDVDGLEQELDAL